MTAQKCIDGCAAAGFSSAGLEFGRECYCGNEGSPLADQADINECNMPCLGDASQFCGNADRLLVYHKPSTNPSPTPSGSWAPIEGECWRDNTLHQRALEHPRGGFDDLTPEKCQSLCENAGFSLAGVEFGRECFCGNTIMGDNRRSYGGNCLIPCTGDSSKKCGGRDAINIFVKDNFEYTAGPANVLDSYNGWSKTQCWQDHASNRILKQGPAMPIPEDLMTVQKCIDGCAAAGFSSAGVEFGRECFCDNVTYPPGQSEQMSECNKPCTGDGTQFCGGPDRILIYTPMTSHRGIIEVSVADTGDVLGYFSGVPSINGITTYTTEDYAQVVTFQTQTGSTSATQVEFTKEDRLDAFPFLGLVQGSLNFGSDLGPGTREYLYLTGTTHSGPGAKPQTGDNAFSHQSGISRTFESSIWSVDLTTGALIPQWVNTDGSVPVLTVLYNPDPRFAIFFVVGDPDEFRQMQSQNTDFAVAFKFVPRP
ncbi:hypothetical protein FRC17_004883 [Serendipita sp. 399]|nr:hypothetical protein FRC17_004883 [Serendipita sp. 399]